MSHRASEDCEASSTERYSYAENDAAIAVISPYCSSVKLYYEKDYQKGGGPPNEVTRRERESHTG